MKLTNHTQNKINRISFDEIQRQIKALNRDLALASTKDQKNYFEMELLVLEEYLANVLSRGRR